MIVPTSFPDKAQIAELTASVLLEVETVHFRPEDPYKLTSG